MCAQHFSISNSRVEQGAMYIYQERGLHVIFHLNLRPFHKIWCTFMKLEPYLLYKLQTITKILQQLVSLPWEHCWNKK
jgi:hypothetical protein